MQKFDANISEYATQSNKTTLTESCRYSRNILMRLIKGIAFFASFLDIIQ